jgi:hypothetical protein
MLCTSDMGGSQVARWIFVPVLALMTGACLNPAKGPKLPAATTEEETPDPSRGRTVVVRLEQTVSTETARPGDPVRARVAAPLVDKRGNVQIPDGTLVTGHVRRAQTGKGVAAPHLELVFDRLLLGGRSLPIHGEVAADDLEIHSPGPRGDPKARADAGAALGAIMFGVPGLVLGFQVGTAAGMTNTVQDRVAGARLPAGSFLTLKLL